MSTPVAASKGHVLLFAYGVWGHTRPLLNFAVELVKRRGVHVTVVVQKTFYDLSKAELSRSFAPHDDHISSLIRLIGLAADGQLFINTDGVDASFAEVYTKLAAEEPATDALSGVTYGALPHPAVAVLDGFASGPFQTVRKTSKRPIKVYIWHSGSASATFRILGPEKYGGRRDPHGRINAEVAKGKDFGQAALEVFTEIDGSVINVPGVPPMHDYEYVPQIAPFPPSIGVVSLAAYDTFESADGAVLSSPEDFERDSIEGMRRWFGETGRKIFAVGPLIPFGEQAMEYEKKQSPKSAEIVQFLDAVLKSHGPQSLIYISFGTFFWPSEPEKAWAFLDVLIEQKRPFIFNHSSPFAVIPDSIVQKVKDSGLGLLSPWSPQQLVLAHPATAWFLTHCGHNSVLEAVSRKVPMICWPFAADQPINAIHLEETLNVAYELFEVRSGPGLQPLYRGKKPVGTVDAVRREAREVLAKAFGEDGKVKRENVTRLNEKISHAWDAQGEASKELEAFAASVGI